METAFSIISSEKKKSKKNDVVKIAELIIPTTLDLKYTIRTSIEQTIILIITTGFVFLAIRSAIMPTDEERNMKRVFPLT